MRAFQTARTTTLHPISDGYQPEPSDERLLVRARSGERAALEELLERHRPWIFNLALRMFYEELPSESSTPGVRFLVIVDPERLRVTAPPWPTSATPRPGPSRSFRP